MAGERSGQRAAQRWDLVVLGGGTAGIVGAQTAAGLGARVALVERARPGGDCLWSGCVPSKTLLASASRAADVRSAATMGVHAGEARVDLAAVMARVRAVIATIEPVDSAESLERSGVHVVTGAGRFTGPGALEVAGRVLRFDRALVATGASPAVPDLPGVADALAAGTALTTETVWGLTELPRRLVVVGGGPVGCELGQALARLGAPVVLVHGGERLLPGEDPGASAVLEAALRADGVEVRCRDRAVAVARTGEGVAVTLAGGARVEGSHLLIAAGRTPGSAGLGLESVGVAVDGRGAVVVDAALRTTGRGVWAAGDVTGPPYYTHAAGMDGAAAAAAAVLGVPRRASRVVPRVTFTDPEVAGVGLPTHGVLPRGHVLRTVDHTHVDRAIAQGATEGFSRLRLDRRGRVVGATVVSPRAGEVLGELAVAVARRLRSRDLALVQHAYPTYGDGAWNAAIADLRARLGSPVAAGATSALLAARRARDARRR